MQSPWAFLVWCEQLESPKECPMRVGASCRRLQFPDAWSQGVLAIFPRQHGALRSHYCRQILAGGEQFFVLVPTWSLHILGFLGVSPVHALCFLHRNSSAYLFCSFMCVYFVCTNSYLDSTYSVILTINTGCILLVLTNKNLWCAVLCWIMVAFIC